MKIIPAIDLMEGKVVRLTKGDPENKIVYSNNPIEIAKKWESAHADRIHIVDLDATLGRGSNFRIIKKIAQEISTPLHVAGGLRDKDKINEVFSFAQKAVLGTFAFENKEILLEILKKFGHDRIIISADQLNGKIVVNGWRKDTGIDLVRGIENFVKLGFSEFLLTSVERDGTLQGPDLESLTRACAIKNAKIIASGGISNIQDIVNVKKCGSYGIILGKALYEKKFSIEEVSALA